MTEFTSEFITNWKHAIKVVVGVRGDMREVEKFALEALDEIERLQARVQELEIQLKSKDIIINNQQGRLNYYATKDLFGGKR